METLSIIMPFYKRVNEFEFAFNRNLKYLRDHELVLVLDEPVSFEAVRQIVAPHPFVKLIVNPNDHEWRNPAKPLNVGIKAASADYVLILSPECVLASDVPTLLMNQVGRSCFATGLVSFCTYEEFRSGWPEFSRPLNYGSICVNKERLYRIHGFDESNEGWGGDDDNIRRRLEMDCMLNVVEPSALVFHPSDIYTGSTRPTTKTDEQMQTFINPKSPMANPGRWGQF